MTKYIGIDYGKGLTNIDLDTNIRYGVISLNNVNPDFLDDFETHYPDTIHDPTCEDLENCCCADNLDPTHATYNEDNLRCEYSFGSSMNILFVFKSPVILNCCYCSPCVPGAGDLDNPDPNGIATYGLPENCLNKESI